MENIENAVIDNTLASEHPVLKQLKDKIAELEATIVSKNTDIFNSEERTRKVRQDKWNYEERVKNVLLEALEDHDEETVRYIADQLSVELTKTVQYEVNVTFNIDVEVDALNADSIDPDWDFDFTVSHDSIVDYTSDVVWSNKTS
jgi:hypothetical protein